MQQNQTLWDFSDQYGELHEFECTSKEGCKVLADRWFDEWCADSISNPRNGQVVQEEGEIIEYHFDDDGHKVEHGRSRYLLYWEYYHGDRKEHGTW